MKKFLEKAVETILAAHGHDLSGVLVLMPNMRSCTYFRNTLKQYAEKPVLAPAIETLQNWILQQSDLVPVDNIEALIDLFGCYKDTGGEMTLDEFIGSANVMLDDFNQLDTQVVNAKLFFKNLEDLQSMKAYVPGEEPDEYKIKYRKFWNDFGVMYGALRNKLKAAGKGYHGMILRDVAENLPRIMLDEHIKAVYFVGFNSFDKADEMVVDYLLATTNANMLWDADKYYVNDEMKEAGFFMRRYRSKYRIGDNTFGEEISSNTKNIDVIGAAKNIGQVKVAADILQNKLKLNDSDALNTVVIVPDERLLGPLMLNLPANITSVNITMGLNINGSSSASWLEVLFRLYENSLKYFSAKGVQRYYYRDVFDLLQHSFFPLLFPGVQIDEFIEKMKAQNRVLIRHEEISGYLSESLTALLFIGDDARRYAAYLLANAKQVLDKLISLARAGDNTLASEAEIMFRLHNVLNNTQTIFNAGNTVTIKTYIALLRANIRNEKVPLEGDPVQGLQIMGLLETRSLDFKNVIILSANEGILPAGKMGKTYIPFELQREFLTTYKERDANTAYLFYRLLHKAENVYILYNTEPDELGGGEKSRFILQLQHELPLANTQAAVRDLIFAVDPPVAAQPGDIVIAKEGQVLQKIADLTSGGISPSALNTYINCTLQYYFRYIAGIREQDDMEESLEASSIGNAVHYALEKIYEGKKGKVVDADFINEQLQNKPLIEHLVREELKSRFDNESLSRGKNLLLYKVCVKLVEEFLKYELENVEQLTDSGVGLQIEMLEEKLSHSLDVNGKMLTVAGRVDRIERVGDIVHIADYKTSARSTIPVLTDETWQGLFVDPKYAKPVQLLVYAWLYMRSNNLHDAAIRSGIYWLRDFSKRLDTLAMDKTNDIITRDAILVFEEKLKALLAELTDEKVPFVKTPDVDRCKFCPYIKICNRD